MFSLINPSFDTPDRPLTDCKSTFPSRLCHQPSVQLVRSQMELCLRGILQSDGFPNLHAWSSSPCDAAKQALCVRRKVTQSTEEVLLAHVWILLCEEVEAQDL